MTKSKLKKLATKIAKKNKQRKNAARRTPKTQTRRMATGAVSSINTAPVAIGNSVRGASSQVINTGRTILVRGRDFAFTPIGTGSVTTWTLCGGTPLTPAAFGDTAIRQYMQMYQKFKWRRVIAHYITSSPTSANGDVMFYHAKNRDSVFLNQTSSNLLPYVFSDDDTVIGPQWTNHSVDLTIRPVWKSTDYGMSSVLDDFSEGEVYLLSKTSTTDSPGYVLFDYEIEFAELQLSPRLLALPLPRIQWSQLSLSGSAVATTANSTKFNPAVGGNNISGTSSVIPTGAADGDVYKVIIDATNSTISGQYNDGGGATNWTYASFISFNTGSGNTVLPLIDGVTLYATYTGGTFEFYPNVEAAVAAGNYMVYSHTKGAASGVTFTLQCWMSLVTTISTVNCSPNF